MKSQIDDAELQAYVDGQLPAAQRSMLEAKLQGDAEAMARVAAYREQNRLLRAALDPWLTQPVPARLQHRRVRPRSRAPLRYGAMAASLLLAGAVGWFLRGELQPAPGWSTQVLVQRATQAHLIYAPEVMHPVEVGAAQEQHLVQWLSKRLGKPVRAPRLDPLGFHLVGGRLLPGERRPAAQFMYQDAHGRRLTLYVVTVSDEPNRETAFRYAEDGGISTFYWVEEGFAYALAGQLERERLLPVAQAVYRQVNG